jgi:small multidrug resistance pump
MSYVYLTIAVLGEVIATSALKASEQFTRLWPSLLVVAGYGVAFFFLSLVLQSMQVGIAYAIWSGLGIVLVTIISAVLYGQIPDVPAIIGMVLITVGIVVMNVFSSSVSH